jgi:hypothetical protein
MSTRCTTHFVWDISDKPQAIIYRHTDGYPEGHGTDLYRFFKEIKDNVDDTRFGDPSYLSAKLVVWLANQFSKHYDYETKEMVPDHYLDFISVGVVQSDPGDIEYRYVVECGGQTDDDGYPPVTCEDIYMDAPVEIPKESSVSS